MPSPLTKDLLDALDTLAGGVHPGFRPAHAKGSMYAGTFSPSPAAADLSRAPHASRESTPVTVRFSPSAGIPTVADNDPKGSSPQGMAVRFHLDDHVHTDIVAHSHNGFPARTGEEFLAFLRAVAASGPGSATPPPVVAFLTEHPAARVFVETPKPIPTSYARQAFFAVTAFKFTNAAGASRFGRFRIRPEAGTEYLSADEAQIKTADFLAAELSGRLATRPVRFKVVVQLAEDGDPVTDATAVWPDTRPEVEFGTLTIAERVDDPIPARRRMPAYTLRFLPQAKRRHPCCHASPA